MGCTKEFNRPDKLKAHILSHSGEKTMTHLSSEDLPSLHTQASGTILLEYLTTLLTTLG